MESEKENRIEMVEEAMFRAFRGGEEASWVPSPEWKRGVMDAVRREAGESGRSGDASDLRFETVLFRTACALAGLAASLALVAGIVGGVTPSRPENSLAQSAFNDDIQELYYDDAVSALLANGEGK